MDIRMGDIAEIAHLSGAGFGASKPEKALVLKGERQMLALASGIRVHTLDARAEVDFETRLTRAANFTVHLVLEGPLRASLGGVALDLCRAPGMPVRLGFSALAAPGAFHRLARRGDYLRKVNVAVGWDWLAARGITPGMILGGRAMAQDQWIATPEEIALGEALLAQAQAPADSWSLPVARDALALALLGRVLARLEQAGQALAPRERERLARMEAFAARPGPVPTLEAIAAEGGMSLSSMQRLFQRAHGEPARARVRRLRLNRAAERLRQGESVGACAAAAGYVTPEAFATAFRRAFGTHPSSLHPGHRPRGAAPLPH